MGKKKSIQETIIIVPDDIQCEKRSSKPYYSFQKSGIIASMLRSINKEKLGDRSKTTNNKNDREPTYSQEYIYQELVIIKEDAEHNFGYNNEDIEELLWNQYKYSRNDNIRQGHQNVSANSIDYLCKGNTQAQNDDDDT